MKYILILFLNFLMLSSSYCQEIENDTIPDVDEEQEWSEIHEPEVLLRIAAGFQRSVYGEIGVARSKYIGGNMPLGIAYYTSIEITPTLGRVPEPIYGIKLGGEITTQPYAAALEAKLLSDFNHTNFVITPKIGLGLFGYAYFYYGHNISLNKNPFSKMGIHQISIVTHPLVLSYIFRRKKPEPEQDLIEE